MICNKCKKDCLETELTEGYCIECVNKKEDKKLPMNWFKFWMYIRFPLGFLISISNYYTVYQNIPSSTLKTICFSVDCLFLIFMGITYSYFFTRKKIGYKFLMIWLFGAEWLIQCFTTTIQNTLNSSTPFDFLQFLIEYILVLFIWGLIWVLPNGIYFEKRKNYFNNDIKLNSKDTELKKQEHASKQESWDEYLNDKFKAEGTRTFFKNQSSTSITETEQSSNIKDTTILSKHMKKNNKNTIIILIIALIIVAITTIVLLFYTLNLKQTFEKEKNANEYTIQSLKSDMTKIKESEKKYYNLYSETKKKSNFMDDYIVIVPTNTYVFHKYGCQYLDISSFLAFNIENAKGLGYVACKHCVK